MRKVILQIQVSLDGFLEGPNGEMDWFSHDDEEQWKDLSDLLQTVDTFLLGRGMYPEYAKYWRSLLKPSPSGTKNEIDFAHLADKTPHIVFSRTMKKDAIEWKNTRIVSDDITAEITRLKQEPGPENSSGSKNMVLWGGASIVSTFMNLGLIDEYRIVVNPVVLGGGKPLFNNLNERHQLKLIETKAYPSGAVRLHYIK